MKSSLTKISLAISVTIASLLSLPSAANASNCDALYQQQGWIYSADLSYCNLSDQDFSNRQSAYFLYPNFYRATLENTNLSRVGLYHPNFTSSNASGIKFIDSNVQQFDFSNATARNAQFSGSWINYTKFISTNLSESKFLQANSNRSNFSGANLSNSDLTKSTHQRSNFSGANLTNADLTGAIFRNTSFVGTNLSGANLTGAIFEKCDLSNTVMEGTLLDRTSFRGSTLANISGSPLQGNSRFPSLNGYLIVPGANLAGVDFSGADLSRVDLTRANLRGANLAGANFQGAILKGANFRETSLVGANFTGADLNYSNLNSADASSANFTYTRLFHSSFAGANLNDSIFSRAVIGDANFTGASMESTNLSTAILASAIRSSNVAGEAIMPNSWMLRGGYLLGPFAEINQANLSGLNLEGVNLTGSYLGRANFKDALLSNAKFERSHLDGSNFTNADLSNAVLLNAKVDAVNFTNATLQGVKSGGLVFFYKPKTPTGWSVLNNHLVGPGAVLSGANFNSLDLSGFDLSDAVLYGVNLAGANLNNANLSRVKLSGAILAGATLEGVTSSGIVGQPTVMPDGWVVDGGAVVRALTNTPKPDIQGVYKTNQLLSVRTGSWDSGVEFTYAWLRDGAEISEANASSYRLTSSDTGHQISVRVSGSKAGYQRVSVESRSFFVAEESLAASISGNPRVGAVLTAGPSNLGQATVTYQWFSNGRTVKGATSNTYFPQIQDLGKKISVVATIIGQGSGKIVSTSPHVTISEGILEAPDISMSGIPVMGGSLSANVPAISGVKVTSKWYRDGIAMPVGSSSYTLKSSDVGHRFKVVSTFSKKGFVSAVSHSQEYLVAPAIAVASANPSISGVMQPGKVLKAKSGTWMSNTKFEYQWLRDGVPIEEANFSSYQLLSSDRGKQISVRVTGSKAGYTKLTLLSNSVMFN